MEIEERSVLSAVYKFFREHPEKWTSGALAKDALKNSVDPRSVQACQWCLTGAIAKFDPRVEIEENYIVLTDEWHDTYATVIGPPDDNNLYDLNDDCGYITVMELLREHT